MSMNVPGWIPGAPAMGRPYTTVAYIRAIRGAAGDLCPRPAQRRGQSCNECFKTVSGSRREGEVKMASYNVLPWIPRAPIKDDVPVCGLCGHHASAHHEPHYLLRPGPLVAALQVQRLYQDRSSQPDGAWTPVAR